MQAIVKRLSSAPGDNGTMALRVGISTVIGDRLADPATINALARAAEQLGYSSVWVDERQPSPTPEGLLDALAVVGVLASITTRVGLGASMVLGAHRPDELARRLRSLAMLSGGRLTIGLSPGHPPGDPGVIERLIDELDGHPPPVLVTAADVGWLVGLVGLVGRVDGWHAAGVPADELAARWAQLRSPVAGHAPRRLVVQAVVDLHDQPVTGARVSYQGDLDQIATDLDIAHRAGADEVILGLSGDASLDDALDVYARVAERLEHPSPRRR
jgi:hypothetical protein